jgi:hypothetical protein
MSFVQILYIWLALTVIAAIGGPLSNLVGRRPRAEELVADKPRH